MKTLILIIAAIFALTAVVPARVPAEITVRKGSQKAVPNSRLKVKFVAVTEDSRCPENAQCVWAGVARIKVQVSKNGRAAQEFELNTMQTDKVISFEGFEIKLSDLNRPNAGKPDHSDYIATLTVTKLKK
jgi:hypothetical protein